MRYRIEVFCSGMGFVSSKFGSDSISEARVMEEELRADSSAWVDPTAPKQTRIRDTIYGTIHKREFKSCN